MQSWLTSSKTYLYEYLYSCIVWIQGYILFIYLEAS